MNLNLYENNENKLLLPLSYFKHISELKLGCLSLEEKWQKRGFKISKIGRTYLRHETANSEIWMDASLIVDGDLIAKVKTLQSESCLFFNRKLIGFRTSKKVQLDTLGFLDTNKLDLNSFTQFELDKVKKLDFPWDMISLNASEIEEDIKLLRPEANSEATTNWLSANSIFADKSAKIAPNSVLDASNGSIYIDADATIEPFVYIKGPCYIGKSSIVKAHTTITNSSIQQGCRISGEISTSIQLEYSNKGHEGFMGQSILGSWTNLGAGTTTSNLKNNYSNVSVNHLGERKNIDLQFLGLILGDHSKCAIGTLFNTATIVGACSNIFGNEMPSKFLPSFTWGNSENSPKYQLSKILETAEKVMLRRGVKLTEEMKKQFISVQELANKIEFSSKA